MTAPAYFPWRMRVPVPTAPSSHVPTDWLNGKHTVFGKVTEGQDVVDSIKQGDTISRITIEDDTADLFTEQADRIAAWNKVLGK
mgnify:CR=1 FL=1